MPPPRITRVESTGTVRNGRIEGDGECSFYHYLSMMEGRPVFFTIARAKFLCMVRNGQLHNLTNAEVSIYEVIEGWNGREVNWRLALAVEATAGVGA